MLALIAAVLFAIAFVVELVDGFSVLPLLTYAGLALLSLSVSGYVRVGRS